MSNHITYTPRTAVIDLPHNGYIDWLLRSNSYEGLMRIFKTADSPSKEISESMSALLNMRKFVKISDTPWLHIGDGSMARTASVFAFFSKSENYSIDPLLKTDILFDWIAEHNVQRLHLLKSRIEDSDMWILPPTYNITCVHAHVNLEDIDKHCPGWSYLYTNPCCHPNQQTFNNDYMKAKGIITLVDKLDLGISSERRRVVIYKKINLNSLPPRI